jgi:hypothetical protein
MLRLLSFNVSLPLIAGALALGLCVGCSADAPSDLRVDYTAVAVVPADLAKRFDAEPVPGALKALLDLEPHETGIVLDQLSLTTADRQHGELRGSRFALEQVHRSDGGAPLLLAQLKRARGAGALKAERHVTLDRPTVLGRFTTELTPQELRRETRERYRGAMPELELTIIAVARAPG